MRGKKIIKQLLFEAYRRNDMADSHEKQKDLKNSWLGLGTEAAYRPGIEAKYFIFHKGHTPPRGCMGWLTLTDKGVKAMMELENEFKTYLEEIKKEGYEKTLQAHYMIAGGFTKR